ncbi:MAG: MATE family efflux transporter [bacterium]
MSSAASAEPSAAASPPPTGEPGLGEILRFALPLTLSMLTTAINTTVDMLFIGALGTAPLAAVPLAAFVYMIAWVLLIGVMRNALAFTARAYGAGRPKAIGPILAHYHLLALAGLPLMLLYVQLWPLVAQLDILSPQVRGLARVYLETRAWDISFSMLLMLYTAFYQSIGNSRFPMLVNLAVVAVNIVLDYGLIFGHWGLPALGVKGSALATVIAQGMGAACILAVTFLGPARRVYDLRLMVRLKARKMREILRVGIPQGLGDCVELTSWTVFMLIVGRLGETTLAAGNIGIQVTHLIFLPGFAFGLAASSYIGRFLGAERPDAAKATAGRIISLGVGYMGLMGIPLWFLGETLASAFTSDGEVIRLAGMMFKVMAFYQVIDGLGFITRTALGGAGDTTLPTLALAACALGVMFPGAWWLSTLVDPPLVGAWLGAFGYMAAYAALMQWRFHGGRWLTIRLALEDAPDAP